MIGEPFAQARRRWLAAAAGVVALGRHSVSPAQTGAAPTISYPAVTGPRPLTFPRDHGAHAEYRIEWWYVTGWLKAAERDFGVQITFFRLRPGVNETSTSPFAPRQLLFAHAALADPTVGQLLHEERSARVGLDLASASDTTTDVRIRDWRFALDDRSGVYQANIVGRELAFDLRFAPVGRLVPQGEGGYSRKGPRPEQASYYYSRPQLKVSGRVERRGQAFDVRGTAWLDHEWSSEVMAPTAQGWDWVGISLHDGGAIMAFRMRDAAGGSLWSAASVIAPDGTKRAVAADALRFTATRTWKSPRSGGVYPVAMRVDVGATALELVPLMDDQELDARASVGMVYWEGAVKAIVNGTEVGRGYLELTGYLRRVRL